MKIKLNSKTGVYYAHITGSNPINLKTRNRAEAVKLAKAAKIEELEFAAKARLLTAETVQRLSAGGKVTGEKAVKRWREIAESNALSPTTVHSYESHINRFLDVARMKDRPVSNATFRQVDDFVNAKDDVSAGTRHMRRASLDSFFKVCSAEGFVLGNPAGPVKVKYHQLTFDQKEPAVRVPFTDGELRLLHDIDDPFWSIAVRLAEHYGLRISDIAQLEWGSLQQPGRIIIWTDKRDRRLDLPLTPWLEAMLRGVGKTNGTDCVFPEQAAIMKDPKKRAGLSVQFARLLDSKGIEGKSFHCLRHTFASKRAALGETVDEIRQKMGHESTATTSQYIHQ